MMSYSQGKKCDKARLQRALLEETTSYTKDVNNLWI